MKTTIKEIFKADQLMANIIKRDPMIERGKLGYAWTRFVDKNVSSFQKEYNTKILSVRIENALEDEKKALIRDSADPRGFKYSKQGLKKCIEEEKKLSDEFENTEIEIVPYFCKSLPDLKEEEIEMLKGMVIE